MKIFFRVFLSVIIISACNCEEPCDNLGTLFYEDIGCKAVKKPGQACPIKYECDDFTKNNNSCLFRGKKYALSEQIDRDTTYEACAVACYCNERSHFTCAILDCPEWLGAPIKPGCYRKYELDKCCSVGSHCPSEEKSLKECKVNGVTYDEGEKFYPKNSCLRCVCSKDFNGKFEAPYCKRISCISQVRHAKELQKYCAPFYTEGPLCCPDAWICPASSDVVKRFTNVDINPDLTCKFGTKVLKLGEGIETTVNLYGSTRDARCECILPPLLTCKELKK